MITLNKCNVRTMIEKLEYIRVLQSSLNNLQVAYSEMATEIAANVVNQPPGKTPMCENADDLTGGKIIPLTFRFDVRTRGVERATSLPATCVSALIMSLEREITSTCELWGINLLSPNQEV